MSSTNQQSGTGGTPVHIPGTENFVTLPRTERYFFDCIGGLVAVIQRAAREQGSVDGNTPAPDIPSQRERAHLMGEAFSQLNGKQPIFALLSYEDIRSLEGRLLTIMDASFTDREQRKAAKDLVRNAIWFDWVANLDIDGNGGKPDLRA